MPILNYTTTIAAEKSIYEIIGLLSRKGALSVTQQFANTRIVAVRFSMPVGGITTAFVLPANVEGVFEHMRRNAPPRYRNREQAERVAWRILKDWVEAQIALHESNQAEMAQVFMPYALTDGGQTLYQRLVESNQRQLGTGGH